MRPRALLFRLRRERPADRRRAVQGELRRAGARVSQPHVQFARLSRGGQGLVAQARSPRLRVRAILAERRSRSDLLRRAPGSRIARGVEIRSAERLDLGPEVVIDFGVMLHCGGMEWSPPDGGISIGARSYIGPNSVLFGAGGIELGEAVQVSPGVVITSHQHTFERADVDIRDQTIEFARVVVERDVWIGANATILPGVRIGAGAGVGAGAVVTADVAPGAVALGVPARARRAR